MDVRLDLTPEIVRLPETYAVVEREVTAKTLSLTSNLRTNGLEMTSEPPPVAGQAACKDRIAKRSLIQAATTLDVA
ncbi:hypothetical protein J6590_039903 [Homalodisca vitripennis]|nr:hypothetical protein J6590_084951 [Homalodisca vitripennis]KAG8331552.1 hypothetical protein J6590_039903 [Homalodisca vitripennis]